MVGNKYGNLTVLEEHSTSASGDSRYVCKCDCGNVKHVLGQHLRSGATISCGCSTHKRGSSSRYWTGVGEISSGHWYNTVIRSATGNKGRRKALELTITKEYAWDLFLKQDRKCALSGILITFPTYSKDGTYTASLDRIDSSLGYIPGNVQWVHKDINMMKRTYNNKYFIKMCIEIAKHNAHGREI